jgi:hypothetical protein
MLRKLPVKLINYLSFSPEYLDISPELSMDSILTTKD